MDRKSQTENSREFFLAEYQALQGTMQFVRNDLIRTEAGSAVAVATILSWMLTGGPVDPFARRGILIVALVIAIASGLRALSRNKAADRIARYLMQLETELADGCAPGGYEKSSHDLRKDRPFKYLQPLILSRFLIWSAMLFGPVVLLVRS